MDPDRIARAGLRLATAATLAFIYLPILIIVMYAFNADPLQRWPITGYTLDWIGRAWANEGVRSAFFASLKAAIGATSVALVLGSLIAFAVHRRRFFGREALSFIVVLPIALPGIVTGLALNIAFRTFGIDLGLLTVILAHATFCVVVIFNNVIARLRRTSTTIQEASMDLGADTWQTFRYITFPTIRTALLAGGLLAFALSFDEIIVTTFTAGSDIQTLPIWIFANYQRPNNLPLVNVAAVFILLLSIIPVYVAQRLSSGAAVAGART
ncbi:MAG TPA: ABC transporter permease [Candidatus Limnocylindrales bacterium]|nr:ABC transporter permease [Candidatus Limnocylindrales bacterium]